MYSTPRKLTTRARRMEEPPTPDWLRSAARRVQALSPVKTPAGFQRIDLEAEIQKSKCKVLQCTAFTKQGERCRNCVLPKQIVCRRHLASHSS